MPTKSQNALMTPRSPFQKRTRWLVVTLVLIGLVGVFIFLGQTPAQGYDFSTISVTGDKVSLSDYRGHVVMVNFWATWCPPCRAEMPVIESAYEQYRSQGFIVLAVNNAERSDQVTAFADQFQLTFPVLLDYTANISQQFGVKGYPTSVFLDTKGSVYATHQGMLTVAQLQNYISTGLRRAA
jgi:thiol-disulfide isomerase/thioredoxin